MIYRKIPQSDVKVKRKKQNKFPLILRCVCDNFSLFYRNVIKVYLYIKNGKVDRMIDFEILPELVGQKVILRLPQPDEKNGIATL